MCLRDLEGGGVAALAQRLGRLGQERDQRRLPGHFPLPGRQGTDSKASR